MDNLKPLIPRPISVETSLISGILMIDGNIEQNVIQFRFRFLKTEETAPIGLSVYAAKRMHRFYCTIYDIDSAEIVSPVFDPGFTVGQSVSLIKIEPLIKYFKNNQEFPPYFDN
ncbi:MAG: hypothetical protein FWB77_04675 [Treponema sp.]|nr:hypothetical protein [Treponema sp.]